MFIDLNEEMDVLATMRKEPYDALHYIDFSGEGWVEARISGLDDRGIPSIAACALVCAPDFFPACGQFEVSEWSRSSDIPAQFRDRLWYVKPTPLSEMRFPGNLQLEGNPFNASDTTITAVVGMGKPVGLPLIWPKQLDVLRSSHLPDDAAGVFAPGWDVGIDRMTGAGTDDVAHLAAYALGSPFPEDAKLCAALSTFWPAVAPDVNRLPWSSITALAISGNCMAGMRCLKMCSLTSSTDNSNPIPRRISYKHVISFKRSCNTCPALPCSSATATHASA